MNKKAIFYLAFLALISISLLLHSISYIESNQIYDLFYWIFLAALCESLIVFFKEDRAVSVTFAILLAAQLTYQTHFSVIVAAGSIIFSVIKVKKGVYEHIFNRKYYKTLFNMSNYVISTYLSGTIYQLLVNNNQSLSDFSARILFLLVYILIFLLTNSSILMLLLSLLEGKPFFPLWFSGSVWALPSCFAIAPFGYFIYELYRLPYGKMYFTMLLGPLLLARYSFKLYLESKSQYYKIIKILSAAIEAKDPYTEGHSRRVENYAEKIATAMRLPYNKIESVKIAALLHDIGKIGIEDSILHKPYHLSNEEWAKVREHPLIGVKILDDVEFPDNVKECILYHHEKYDGTGYPKGIKKDEIPLEAYILSTADAYDAMTSDRPYRRAMTKEQAIEILQKDKGTHFHPEVVDKFIEILQEENG